MKVSIHREVSIERTPRAELLEAMFEVPAAQKLSVHLEGELPLNQHAWNIGLIVGPSGSGKTLLLNEVFGTPENFEWSRPSVIDDFPKELSMEGITNACQSVGFNTIPSWLRPYSVLSNGERFRASIARHLLASRDPIVIDEFTSVVDRQVAKITASAVRKYIRANSKRLVAASCHYDIIDWLDPDWLIEPAGHEVRFQWRQLRCHQPPISVEVSRAKHETWELFREFHYMSQELNKAARCYGLYVEGRIASFCGVLHRPHPRVRDIVGVSRVVTLPDWQGLGLAMCLVDTVASAYKAIGKRLHQYPNHPAMVRSYQRSQNWISVKEQGNFSPRRGATSTVGGFGNRRCAVFFYVGKAMEREKAEKLIGGGHDLDE